MLPKGKALQPPDPATKGSQKQYTLKTVAQHNTPDDCWLIVRGKVYDVTGWAAQHPGGNMIFVKAGGECTQLFDSYHPLSSRCAHPLDAAWAPHALRARCAVTVGLASTPIHRAASLKDPPVTGERVPLLHAVEREPPQL